MERGRLKILPPCTTYACGQMLVLKRAKKRKVCFKCLIIILLLVYWFLLV